MAILTMVQILVSPGVSLSDVDSVYEGSVFAPEEDLSEPQALLVYCMCTACACAPHCACIALYTQRLRTGPLLLVAATRAATHCSLLTAHCSLHMQRRLTACSLLTAYQVHTEPLLISSRRDLTLEDVDLFLDSLGCNLAAEARRRPAPALATVVRT
jgi:hypothetical protein